MASRGRSSGDGGGKGSAGTKDAGEEVTSPLKMKLVAALDASAAKMELFPKKGKETLALTVHGAEHSGMHREEAVVDGSTAAVGDNTPRKFKRLKRNGGKETGEKGKETKENKKRGWQEVMDMELDSEKMSKKAKQQSSEKKEEGAESFEAGLSKQPCGSQ